MRFFIFFLEKSILQSPEAFQWLQPHNLTVYWFQHVVISKIRNKTLLVQIRKYMPSGFVIYSRFWVPLCNLISISNMPKACCKVGNLRGSKFPLIVILCPSNNTLGSFIQGHSGFLNRSRYTSLPSIVILLIFKPSSILFLSIIKLRVTVQC